MSEAAGHPPPHALLRPRIAIPFVLVALIWGSTWYVITGQIAEVPPSWSITYRFALATPAMFALATIMRQPLAMTWRGHALALLIGLTQFCGNFNFVYRAEQHLTSGVVAVMFGMLMVPNALLGWWWLGQKVTRRFLLGSAIAIAGIALLLVHEANVARLGGNVLLGVALAVGGIMSASISNVAQAGRVGRAQPIVTLLAFSMLYGTLIDAAIAWALAGPPVIPSSASFWSGTAWLALAGSVVTFPLYYGIIRAIGPGRTAYNGVLVIVVAMLISTLIEGFQWSLLAIAGATLGTLGMIIALRARQV
ncbi:membrane protein [Tsuneonella deserti]|uniref:Membrane protein n=1 Tax=Tsuneonella deserti TaxID=2035528 RepID=A0ABQ1SCP3_9SPHN|nr:DMT family transporter [Tsuneonella deserti]GGE05084.1 membrane protein [Tsuneonella deserti]